MDPEIADNSIPLAGMASELRQLIRAIEHGESVLLLGMAGSGKTRLIECAERALRGRMRPVHIPRFESLHDLVVILTKRLMESGHQNLRSMLPSRAHWERWLTQQTSVHLKGLLWHALGQEPRVLVLDGVTGASFPVYRFLQRLSHAPGMVLLAAARDPAKLGALARLFWDPRRRIQLKPLSNRESLLLFERAVEYFGVRHPGLDEFREKVLASAKGNPGQIVEMCRLVAKPQYVSGSYIKFGLVRIDAMMRYLG